VEGFVTGIDMFSEVRAAAGWLWTSGAVVDSRQGRRAWGLRDCLAS
jgi:hypothetical protein